MVDCHPTKTPMEDQLKLKKRGKISVDVAFYGSLWYLLHRRPDLIYSMRISSRYMVNPTCDHWTIAKRVIMYLKGTNDFGSYF